MAAVRCYLGTVDFRQLAPDKTTSPPGRNILSDLTGKDPDDQIKCFNRYRVVEHDGVDVETSQTLFQDLALAVTPSMGNPILQWNTRGLNIYISKNYIY